MDKIPHGFGPIVNGCTPNLVKPHRCVKRIGYRVRRVNIHLANNEMMTSQPGTVEQIAVQATCVSPPTYGRRDYHPINVHEMRVSLPEPEIIEAVITGHLIEGDQEATSVINMPRVEGLPNQGF
jgi:hypothetical protein